MNITFACDRCYSQFTVDSRLAGRKARCRKCNHKMLVPDGSDGEPAPDEAAPEPAKSSRRHSSGSKHRSARHIPAPEPPPVKGAMSWLDAVNSQIGMKPITIMSEPTMPVRDEEFESSITSYKLPVTPEMRPVNAVVNKTKNLVNAGKMETVRSYKQFFKRFAKLFRRVNEISYGLSIVFFIMAIVGGFMGQHSLTVTGISLIVLLNVIGLAAAISNLIALQFRGNPIKGLMFLLPPVTLYYLWTNSTKWKKPLNRVLTPMVVLCAVVGAYAYIPWLNGDKSGQGSWQERIEGGFDSLKHDLGDKYQEARDKADELKDELPDDLKNLDVDKIKKKVSDTVDEVTDKFQEPRSRETSSPEAGSKPPKTDGRKSKPPKSNANTGTPRQGDSPAPGNVPGNAPGNAPANSEIPRPTNTEIGRPQNTEIGRPKNTEIGGPQKP